MTWEITPGGERRENEQVEVQGVRRDGVDLERGAGGVPYLPGGDGRETLGL